MNEETCCVCDAPTGRAGRADDSLYCEADDTGPYCDDCYPTRENMEAQRAQLARLQEELERAQQERIVPGVMRCAKCHFRLVRTTIHYPSASFSAGDSKTEPCPNGCGPLWPVTWQDEARENLDRAEEQMERAEQAETALVR